MNEVISQTEDKMKKAIAATQRDFASVRTGRASAALLDRISIDYYGTDTPIKGMANISVPDGRTLQIQAYDRASVQLIEKAIQKSDLGLTPNTDGNTIRLNIPALTEERRKELVKVLSKSSEEGKIAIRNIRRDGTDALKRKQKASELTEDELKRGEEQIQKLTDRYVKELDELLAAKQKEVMEV
ncbi:MAG: rrf [Cyanobacteria bacterium RYN_339]|nr:rrf [Cyanobacteria bacterium RYN_339]